MFEVIGVIVSIWFVVLVVLSIKPITKAVRARIEFDAFMAERIEKETRHAK